MAESYHINLHLRGSFRKFVMRYIYCAVYSAKRWCRWLLEFVETRNVRSKTFVCERNLTWSLWAVSEFLRNKTTWKLKILVSLIFRVKCHKSLKQWQSVACVFSLIGFATSNRHSKAAYEARWRCVLPTRRDVTRLRLWHKRLMLKLLVRKIGVLACLMVSDWCTRARCWVLVIQAQEREFCYHLD